MNSHYTYKNQDTIIDILGNCHTVAVVGLSSQPHRAGYYVPAYLQRNGYRVIPVNPNLDRALEEVAYPDLLAIPEPVDLVLVFRRSEAVPPVVDQAIQIGARALWMQLGVINLPAAEAASQAGLQVVMDACMMVEHRRFM